MLGFGLVAAGPYLLTAGKSLAAGEEVSMKEVAREVSREQEKKEKMEPEKMREIKAFAMLPDGTQFAGNKAGIVVKSASQDWTFDSRFKGGDVKMMTVGPDGLLWAISKYGVYTRAADGAWAQVYDGDSHSLSFDAQGAPTVAGKKGVFQRDASGKWQSVIEKLPDGLIPAGSYEEKKKEDYKKDHDQEHAKTKEM